MKISLIMPGRNNLRYAKWSYEAIQKNKGIHEVEICFADDASSDGTWEWCQEMIKQDPNFKAIRNDTGKRVGHTILYDRLVNEVCTNEIAMIWHCDMYLTPGALDAIEQYMYDKVHTDHAVGGWEYIPNKKRIVSLTRIEPPLHPPGVEKIIQDFGVEPEEFDEQGVLSFVNDIYRNRKGEQSADFMKENEYFLKLKTTEGIFAPWAFWVDDFKEIGGHDPLYRPQSKEDSSIFNRFQLNGVKFIQTWDGFVYHMTCRGSRRNTADKAKNIYEDSPEWLAQNKRSTRNFIRMWGTMVRHDIYMKPIIPHKYNIGIRLDNAAAWPDLLELLEPHCDNIYLGTGDSDLIKQYIENEQPNTDFDLTQRIHQNVDKEDIDDNIIIYVDGRNFNEQDYHCISNIADIISDSGEVGEFGISNIKLNIKNLDTFEHKLIHSDNSYLNSRFVESNNS